MPNAKTAGRIPATTLDSYAATLAREVTARVEAQARIRDLQADAAKNRGERAQLLGELSALRQRVAKMEAQCAAPVTTQIQAYRVERYKGGLFGNADRWEVVKYTSDGTRERAAWGFDSRDAAYTRADYLNTRGF